MFVSATGARVFFFPVEIIDAAAKLGVTLNKLHDMVQHSTRMTHPLGNRRYNDYLFMVEGQRVIGFGLVSDESAPDAKQGACPYCDRGLVRTTRTCPHCGGAGCPSCRSFGGQPGRIVVFDECERCEGSGKMV